MAIARTLVTTHSAVAIAAGASSPSTEVDIGNNTVADQIWIYLQINSWAGNPGGNERFQVQIHPRHTTGGDDFDDDAISYWFPTTGNQAYYFSIPITSLPRFLVVSVLNDTTENATGVTVIIEMQKIT